MEWSLYFNWGQMRSHLALDALFISLMAEPEREISHCTTIPLKSPLSHMLNAVNVAPASLEFRNRYLKTLQWHGTPGWLWVTNTAHSIQHQDHHRQRPWDRGQHENGAHRLVLIVREGAPSMHLSWKLPGTTNSTLAFVKSKECPVINPSYHLQVLWG